MISRALTWLCEPPQGDFTLSWVLRRGWPGFAEVVLLPKPLALGRAARLVERVIFLGAMGGFIFYGGLPLGSLGRVSGLTDGLELAAIVKVIAILAGWVVQFSLKILAYVVGGFERVLTRRPIDLERYARRKKTDDVEKVLSDMKAVEDRKAGVDRRSSETAGRGDQGTRRQEGGRREGIRR